MPLLPNRGHLQFAGLTLLLDLREPALGRPYIPIAWETALPESELDVDGSIGIR